MFPAEPDLFTTEIRAAFRSLRQGGVMSTTVDTATEIRSFQIEIPEKQIDDLRRRIAATRWPSKELVEDRSQGVQLATLRELARYWTTEYDWRGGRMFPSSNDGVISEVGASQRRLHLPVESPSPSPSATTAWAKRSLRCAQSRLFACATLRLTMTPMCCPFELPSWARTRTLLIHRGHSNRPREVPGQAFRNSGSQTKCTT
jgi:Epoxide hydrolase N terminus